MATSPLRVALLAAIVLACFPTPRVSADALRKVDRAAGGRDHSERTSRAPAGEGSARPAPSTRTPESGEWDLDSDSSASINCFDEEARCGFAQTLALAPFYAMYRVLALPWTEPRRRDDPTLLGYARYPFAHGPALLRDGASASQPAYKVALDMELESGFLVQGVLPASVAVRLHLPRRIELDGRFTIYDDVREQPHELALAGQTHLVFRHAQTRRLEFRSGIGARLFSLTTLRAGVDVLYAVDGYFARHGVVRVELHAGSLGQAFVGQARATVGVALRQLELYAGYDHTAFIRSGRTALGGPVAGLRGWF